MNVCVLAGSQKNAAHARKHKNKTLGVLYLLPYATLSPVCHRGDGCTCPCGITWLSV